MNKHIRTIQSQHPDNTLLGNCDMLSLTEIFDSIILAQKQAVVNSGIISTSLCCDVDTIDTDYPE